MQTCLERSTDGPSDRQFKAQKAYSNCYSLAQLLSILSTCSQHSCFARIPAFQTSHFCTRKAFIIFFLVFAQQSSFLCLDICFLSSMTTSYLYLVAIFSSRITLVLMSIMIFPLLSFSTETNLEF